MQVPLSQSCDDVKLFPRTTAMCGAPERAFHRKPEPANMRQAYPGQQGYARTGKALPSQAGGGHDRLVTDDRCNRTWAFLVRR